MAEAVRKVQFNTRPLCDALARLDALVAAGAFTAAELARILVPVQADDEVETLVRWERRDALWVAHPAEWLADLIQAAGAR